MNPQYTHRVPPSSSSWSLMSDEKPAEDAKPIVSILFCLARCAAEEESDNLCDHTSALASPPPISECAIDPAVLLRCVCVCAALCFCNLTKRSIRD